MQCYGQTTIDVAMNNKTFSHSFHICDDNAGVILGVDFMREHHVVLKPNKNEVTIDEHTVPTHDMKGYTLHHRVKLNNTVHVRPGEQRLLTAKVVGKFNIDGRPVLLEPSRTIYGKTGAVVCKIAARAYDNHVPLRVVNPGDDTITIYKGTTVGVLSDVTEASSWEEKARDTASDISNSCATVSAATDSTSTQVDNEPDSAAQPAELPDQVKQLYEDSKDRLNEDQRKDLFQLLDEYSDIFAKNSADFGKTTILKHNIDTGDEPPVKQRPRRFPRHSAEELKRQVTGLAEKNIIRPSTSSWASNALLVKKKDGTYRMCIDYRELNAKTKNLDEYMLPRIDDTIDALSRAKFFCTLDLIQGYHQVELEEHAKHKTAFIAPQCNPSQWEFNYMPFGLKGAPRTFQRMMDHLLLGLDYKVALAYLDDIIVYGATIEDCMKNLQLVFERIRGANLKLKAKKCSLFQLETLYLGHIISGDGVRCDPEKIKAVKDWKPPRHLKQVRSFLGLVNYYRRFIRNYTDLAIPLYDLQRKKTKFRWGDAEQRAFEELRAALISAPVMAFPQEQGRYILDTDASGYAIGGVLSQLQRDETGAEVERVIAYASRRLQGREQRYCARKRELLAIVHFVKHFDVYLRGPAITIRTDHASLKYIKTLKELPDQFARWIMTLENYHYSIEVRKGVLHSNADTLSRYACCDGKNCMCSGVAELEERGNYQDDYDPDNPDTTERTRVSAIKFGPEWSTEEMAHAQSEDADIAPLYRAKKAGEQRPDYNDISGGSPALKLYWAEWRRLEMHDGLLYRRWEDDAGVVTRLQLIVPFKYQREISKRLHGPQGAAHLGRKRTTDLISKKMFWYQMADNIKFWVQVCDVCQRRKRPGQTPRAPMREYMSGYCNERVQMDLCGPVKESYYKNKYLLVITDRFSKFTKAFPIPDKEKKTVAERFVSKWIYEYGEPEQVHTDQGGEFEADLMKHLCILYDIKKTRTSPFHPQGNAQVERYNQTIATMLNTLSDDYEDWDMKIPLAVSSYNATINATTGFTPNKLWFGRELYMRADRVLPRNPLLQRMKVDKYVERLEEDMRIAYEVARQTIGRNMKVQKRYHDRNAHLNKYKVGDAVLKRSTKRLEKGEKKFADRWEGPFFIIDILDDTTYRIGEDEQSPRKVLHHDRLKPYHFDPDVQKANEWVFRVTKSLPKAEGIEVAVQTENNTATAPPADEEVESVADVEDKQLEASTTADNQRVGQDVEATAEVQDELEVGEPQQDLSVAGDAPEAISTAETEAPTDIMSERKTIRITTEFPDVREFKNVERRGRPRKVIRVRALEAPLVVLQPRKKIKWSKYRRLSTAYQPLHYVSESEKSEYED